MMSKIIKLLLIAILGLTYALSAKDDKISQFFEKYSNLEGVTFVSFTPTPALLDRSKEQLKDEDARELMKNINNVQILTSKKRGMRKEPDKGNIPNLNNIYQDALKSLPFDEFEKFLEVREGKKDVKMHYKKSNEKTKVKEFLMLIREEKELTIIWIEGLFDVNDLTKLSKMFKK